jgi:Transglycosylase SLT domain
VIYSKPELILLAVRVCEQEKMDSALVCSIIETLSQWNPGLVEQSLDPQQFNPAIASCKSPNARLGLLQIDSQVAKDLGYKQSQQELMEPTLNVLIGCRLLKKALSQTQGEAGRAILITYGYSVSSLIPRIYEKVKPYQDFLSVRPTVKPSLGTLTA